MVNKAKKSLLSALALAGLSLFSSPKVQADSFLSVGLSSPSHGLLALRGVYDFNENVGVQADLGIGFSSIDVRLRKGNFYGYAGVIGISPWLYALANKTPAQADGPVFGADLGVGFEINPREEGWNFGIEGGLILPIPPQPDTGVFRIDANLMYRFKL